MDFFEDDEDEGKEAALLTKDEKKVRFMTEVTQEILKFILSHREHQLSCEILFIILADSPLCEQIVELTRKLQQVKVGNPLILSTESINSNEIYYPSSRVKRVFDFVIDFSVMDNIFESLVGIEENINATTVNSSLSSFGIFYHLVNPGGYLLTCEINCHTNSPRNPLFQSSHFWVGEFHPTPLILHPQVDFLGLKRRSICCNTRGALYWGANGVDPNEKAISNLRRERDLLEEITVTQYVHNGADYRKYGLHTSTTRPTILSTEEPFLQMTTSSRDKAVDALRKHGLCIIRNVFPAEVIHKWGNASLKDLDIASACLKSTRGIDLENPQEGQIINNFHELSMREARRVDLRNGVTVKQMIQEEEDKWNESNTSIDQLEHSLGNIRKNPDLLDILERAMYEMTPREMGNWGRWNFNGGGPSLTRRIPLTVGKPGAVVSLGGCLDQTIHADTAHIFSHVQLPPHYVNLFLYSVAPFTEESEQRFGCPRTGEITKDGLLCGCCDLRVGQTVFIAGSQDLLVSDKCMNYGEEGENEIMRRIVRPHLHTGDVLLFDCRILHFGLANESCPYTLSPSPPPPPNEAMIRRPIVYVNYHHKWFNDPKNWNDNEKLFE